MTRKKQVDTTRARLRLAAASQADPMLAAAFDVIVELRERNARLERFAEIGRKVSGSRATPSQEAERKQQYERVWLAAIDVLKDGKGHRGLARRVFDKHGRKLGLRERQIRRILKAVDGFLEEEALTL